ncbi:MAG TPA: sulfatase-like hydrolase/transferase [Terriglobales bacterium]|nr:sulfatase-like hydrolase/transferase [Terriglobales bacterium]
MPIRLLLVLFFLGSSAAAASRPNVVLITLDTTRADRMGFLGSTRGLTPNLDVVAKQSVVFTRAYSHVPITTASHASLLTGTYPQYNHVNDFGVPLAPTLPYLPDLLKHNGYSTAAFVGSVILDPLGGMAPGFDRGFDVYDAGFKLRPRGADRYKTIERRAGVVVAHALAWLNQHQTGPFFLWVHLYDAHDPYDPPEPYKTRYKDSPYDGEIASTDAAVGKLFATLRAKGLYQNTLIAVAADHGEAFGEHGERTHGIFLYDETIHVPLLLKLPAGAVSTRVETRVGLIDVAPTILKAVGANVPPEMQGESLLSIIKVKSAVDRPAYAETDYPHRAFGWSSLRALRSGKYLYVQAPAKELYDQLSDARAEHNLAESSPAVTNTLYAQADALRSKTSSTIPELAGLTPEQAQKLQALGYVASDTNKTESKTTEDDPKQKIEIANLLHDAMLDVEDARYEEAIPGLEKVTTQQPTMAIAQMQLGIARASLKQYDQALEPLKIAVKLLPDSGMGHYQMGLALFETGDWQGAAPEFEASLTRAPKWADAHFSLAAVYARIDRVPEAITELNTTLGLSPEHYRANLLRGRILSLQGKPEEAIPNLERAAEVQPESREAHLFLSQAYAQLGRTADARKEQEKVDMRHPQP